MPHVSIHPDHCGKMLRLMIDRPKGNVISGEVMAELKAAIEAAPATPNLRLITLQAAGDHFSFGAAVEEHTPDLVMSMLEQLNALIMTIAASPVPVAAMVQGKCLGGAFEIVLAAHFIFATHEARFGVPEIRLGVFPPAAAALLPRRLNQATAERWMLSGEEVGADEAHRLGLVHKLYAADSLKRGVDEWFAVSLGQYSASSVRHATAAARAEMLPGLADALAARSRDYVEKLLPTHDANEGIAAFMERRRPQWRDA